MRRLIYFACLLVIGLTATDAITIVDNVTYGRISFMFMVFLALFSPNVFLPNSDNYIKILFLFVLFVLATIVFSQYIYILLERFLYLIQYLLIVIIVGNVIQSKRQIYNMLLAYCVGCLFIAYFMFHSYSNDIFIQSEQAYQIETVGNPNENAFLIVYAFIISFILLKNKVYNSKVIRIILYASIIVFVLAVFSSASRMGFILMVISASMILISFLKFRIMNLIFLLISAVAIYSIVDNYITDLTLERLFNVTNDIENFNLAGRTWIWSKAGMMIGSDEFNWFIGEGWGAFPYALQQYTGYFRGAHNFYIALLYDTGLFGCLIVLVYFINLSLKLLRYRKKEDLFYYLLLLIPLISMLSTNWGGRRWWFLIGLFIYKINDLTKVQSSIALDKRFVY